MAASFNLTARLNFSGPVNARPIAQQIRNQLKNINATINLKVNAGVVGNINSINSSLQTLSGTLVQVANNATKAQAALQSISNSFNGSNNSVKNTATALNNVATNAASAGKNLKSAANDAGKFGREAALAVKRAGAFAIASASIFGFVRAVSSGIDKAIEFEKSVVKLQQVSRLSKAGLKGLTDEIDRLSTSLGVSSSELLEVSKILAQAGLSISETKTALDAVAKSTLAPSFEDTINTTEGLIAIMGQFKDELTGVGIGVQDFEKVLGSINRVSADFAVEADDIVAAIRKTGGVFASASSGLGAPVDRLNELVAVFTSVRATTRESADSIATGLRTIFSRIQRPDTIEFIREYGVELQDLEGNFVGPYEALKRLSSALSNLNPRNERFGQLVEELGGIRQIGKLIPAIQQFDVAQKALSSAQRGQTSLNEDAIIAQQSLANQIAKTRENFLKLVRDITNTSSFQTMIRSVLAIADAFTRMADKVKDLLPILAAVGAVKLFRYGLPSIQSFVGSFKGQRRADGGFIDPMKFARGGLVPGQGDSDSVPAQLMPGEYVIRKAAVKAIGADRLHALNSGTQRFATGGAVPQKPSSNLSNIVEELDRLGVNRQVVVTSPNFKGNLQYDAVQDFIKRSGVTLEDVGAAQELRKSKGSSGPTSKVNIAVQDKLAALFFNPVGFKDQKINNSISLTSKDVAGNTGNVIARRLGVKPSDLGNISLDNGYALGINADARSVFEDRTQSGILTLLRRTAQDFASKTGGRNIPDLKSGTENKFFEAIGGNGLLGSMFEGFISLYTSSAASIIKGGVQRGWDFNLSQGSNFSNMFGPQINKAKFADAKFSDSAENRRDIIRKAANSLAEGELNINSVRRYAKGGAATDTVPALLTPGEFVIRREAAAALGKEKLDRLNHAEKVRGYAEGGFVERFVDGGATPQAVQVDPSVGLKEYQTSLSEGNRPLVAASRAMEALGKSVGNLEDLLTNTTRASQELENALQDGFGIEEATRRAIQASESPSARERPGVNRSSLRDRASSVVGGVYSGGKSIAFGVGRGFMSGVNGLRGFTKDDLMDDADFGATGPDGSLLNPNARNSQQKRQARSQLRAERSGRIQNSTFMLGAGIGVLTASLPQARTANQAGTVGALQGAGGGAAIGAQVGSMLGPWGTAIGAAAGAVVGGLQGFAAGFHEFEAAANLKKLNETMKTASEALGKFALGTGSQGDLDRSLNQARGQARSVDSSKELANQFSIGNLLGNTEISPFGVLDSGIAAYRLATNSNETSSVKEMLGFGSYKFSDASRQVQSFFGGQSVEELKKQENLAAARAASTTRVDTAIGSAEGLKDLFVKGKRNLDRNDVVDIGLASSSIREKALAKVAEQNITDDADGSKKTAALETEAYNLAMKELIPVMDKARQANLKHTETQKALERAQKESIKEVELFAEGLSKAKSVMDAFNTFEARNQDAISTALDRAGGGTKTRQIIATNPLNDIRVFSREQIKEAFASLRGAGVEGAGIDRLQSAAFSMKNLDEKLPELVNKLSSTSESDVDGKAGIIRKFLKENGGNLSEAQSKEAQAALQGLVTTAPDSTKDAKQIATEVENLIKIISPSNNEFIARGAEILKKRDDSRQAFSQNNFAIQSIKQESRDRSFGIEQEKRRTLLGLEEERTGQVNIAARFGLQNREVANLTGGTTNSGAILAQIRQQEAELKRVEDNVSNNRGDAETAKKNIETMNRLVLSIDRNKKALDILSKNTEKLAAIDAELNKVKEQNTNKAGTAIDFAASSLEERRQTLMALQVARTFETGDRNELARNAGANPQLFQLLKQGIDIIRSLNPERADAIQRRAGGILAPELEVGFRREEALREAKRKLIEEGAETGVSANEINNADIIRAEALNTNALISLTDAINKAFNLIPPQKRAEGGYITGPGTGTSDSIPAQLSHGEFVIRAASVNRLGRETLDHMNRTGSVPGFAEGGKPTLEQQRQQRKKEYEDEMKRRRDDYMRRTGRNPDGTLLVPKIKQFPHRSDTYFVDGAKRLSRKDVQHDRKRESMVRGDIAHTGAGMPKVDTDGHVELHPRTGLPIYSRAFVQGVYGTDKADTLRNTVTDINAGIKNAENAFLLNTEGLVGLSQQERFAAIERVAKKDKKNLTKAEQQFVSGLTQAEKDYGSTFYNQNRLRETAVGAANSGYIDQDFLNTLTLQERELGNEIYRQEKIRLTQAKERRIRDIADRAAVNRGVVSDEDKNFIQTLTPEEKKLGSGLYRQNADGMNNVADSVGDAIRFGEAAYGFGMSLLRSNARENRLKKEEMGFPTYSTGGNVSGPGSPTSDSILARVSNGEYILNANAAGKLGRGVLNHINRTGSLPKFKTGGEVGSSSNPLSGMFDFSGMTKGLSGILNSFNQAISEFSKQLSNIPLKIQMTGTHEVNVNVSGLGTLQSQMADLVRTIVAEEIGKQNKIIASITAPEQRIEGGYT